MTDSAFPRTELMALMREIAVMKGEMAEASEQRKAQLAETRDIRQIVGELRGQLAGVSVLSEGLVTMRALTNDRFDKVHTAVGNLQRGDSDLVGRLAAIEDWRRKSAISSAVSQVWIGWLCALGASVGTVLLTELVHWLVSRGAAA